jgi:hypothetical protein
VGRTEGVASVAEIGAARYEIPLRVLPGTNGLQPSLSLQYRSDRENGIVGMGFAVTGFSAITRCNKTFAQDGFPASVARTVNDALCLDDQRLRLVSGSPGVGGSVYRTEVETYAKIVAIGSAGGGPAGFEVRRLDGLIYEYGQDASARIEYPNDVTVRAWALSGIRDRAGNRIDFTYIEDGASGGYRPNAITYNGNPSAGTGASTSINFIYESNDRPDPIYAFVDGGPAHQFKRLSRIEMQQQGSMVRQYLLSYTANMGASGRSRLGSAQECASTTSDCLAATQLTWTNSVASLQPEENPGQAIPGSGISTLHFIDISGDGRDDLVYVSSDISGAGTWRVRRATVVMRGRSTRVSPTPTTSRRCRCSGTEMAALTCWCRWRTIATTCCGPTGQASIHPLIHRSPSLRAGTTFVPLTSMGMAWRIWCV